MCVQNITIHTYTQKTNALFTQTKQNLTKQNREDEPQPEKMKQQNNEKSKMKKKNNKKKTNELNVCAAVLE